MCHESNRMGVRATLLDAYLVMAMGIATICSMDGRQIVSQVHIFLVYNKTQKIIKA